MDIAHEHEEVWLQAMRADPVFRHLALTDQRELLARARVRDYEPGAILCHQGAVWSYAALLVTGEVQWSMVSYNGRRQVVFRIPAPHTVWAHSLFDGQPMPATLEAVTPTHALLWPREVVQPIISRRVDAVWGVAQVLVTWMRQVRERLYDLAFRSVSRRVARVLLQHYPAVEHQPLPRDLTLDEMAAMVGTSREFVCRVLQRMAREGILRLERHHLVFTDRQRLQQLAQQEG